MVTLSYFASSALVTVQIEPRGFAYSLHPVKDGAVWQV